MEELTIDHYIGMMIFAMFVFGVLGELLSKIQQYRKEKYYKENNLDPSCTKGKCKEDGCCESYPECHDGYWGFRD